jgi:alpha-mannosidase
MLADTTIGESLRKQLSTVAPTNVLLSGSLLKAISQSEPDSLAAIKQALADDRLGIIGGEEVERELPLLSCEAVREEIVRGKKIYEDLLGRPVEVFGRRRFGLTPNLPSLLQKLGFVGAVHATFEDGRFPEGGQIKIRWQGRDGTGIDAIARAPLDASKPATYLSFATKMGESMDMDHVATICLAHWPARASIWHSDLQRISKYGPVLGRFVTVDQYFRDTDYPAHTERFEAGDYQSPYLKQAVIRKQENPISTWIDFWRRVSQDDCCRTLDVMSTCMTGDVSRNDDSANAHLDSDAVDDARDRFFASIPRRGKDSVPSTGYLVVNTHSFTRRVSLDVSELPQLPVVQRPIYAAAQTGESKQVVVDVPPLGFVWVSGSDGKRDDKNAPPPLADECMLRNEFMEVHFDPTTGAIRSIHDYGSRRNRFSQQLAYRFPTPRGRAGEVWQDPDENAQYSVMAADSVEITQATPLAGEITTRGRLLDREGKTLARFTQKSRITRGSRILRLDIHLEPEDEPTAASWNSYYCCRMAWADEASDVWRAVNNVRQPVGGKRFEAPQYIEIENGEQRTAILTGGLPYHHRQGYRMLDSLFIVRGERRRDFQIGIGIDVPYPMHAALDFVTPPMVSFVTSANRPYTDSAWLFHFDSKNVVATSWQPLINEGAIQGFRTRLLETAGRRAKIKLSAFKNITSARQVDFCGQSLGDCEVTEGAIRMDLAANEWLEIEARW